MKKLLFIVLLSTLAANAFAKKIKFAVDMTGETINTTGMHIVGDFQTLAGFPGGDWNSATTSLTLEAGTNIYSIVVDIPAFAKYEYKFCNGDQSYEVEFVPEESRVGYNFIDNRWIYLDSLADDTTFVGAIIWNQNAPAGLTLVRFYVDMQNEIASSDGVHVAGDFQGWNPQATILYSFGSNIYETISYVTAGTYAYKFYNGNTAAIVETIPGICSVNSNREMVVQYDTLLQTVCYGSCIACVSTAGIAANTVKQNLQLLPNPGSDYSLLTWNDLLYTHNVTLLDATGRTVRQYNKLTGNALRIQKENLENGIYFVRLTNTDGTASVNKLIFN